MPNGYLIALELAPIKITGPMEIQPPSKTFFFIDCSEPATLDITADDAFQLTLKEKKWDRVLLWKRSTNLPLY